MAIDFNASGRIDSFEFEKISCKDLNKKIGTLQGVVGGTLTYGYYTDLQVSGQLQVVDVPASLMNDEYLIRIFFCPTLNGSKQRIELGTFYFTANLHYENGMYKGTLDLRSLLARHIDDVTTQKWTLAKGQTVKTMYSNVFKALGGFPKISGVKNAKLAKTYVFDTGVSPMSILQYIANFAGGEIVVDTHGRTVLQNYISPGNKAKNIVHNIKADANSVMIPGVEVSNSLKEIPNRVVCVFNIKENNTDHQYVGTAALAKNETRSYQKIGRWITKYYLMNNVKKPYVKNLKAQAAKYLKSANHNYVYYEFDCYYQPIKTGEVIYIKYGSISIKGLVTDIDLDLSLGGRMHVKVRKV